VGLAPDSLPRWRRRLTTRFGREGIGAPAHRTVERFVADPVRALEIGSALLGLVVLMAAFVPAAPLGVDRSWSDAMDDIRTHLLTRLALFLNWLGRLPGSLTAIAIIGLLLLAQRRLLALATFALVEILAPLFSSILKALVGRPRPPDGLVHPVGSSFPSGHVTYAGATCIALVLLFTSPGPARRWWWPLALLGIAAMAWSRTYLQVHWLSDVVGGAFLGIGVALVGFAVAQRASGPRAADFPA